MRWNSSTLRIPIQFLGLVNIGFWEPTRENRYTLRALFFLILMIKPFGASRSTHRTDPFFTNLPGEPRGAPLLLEELLLVAVAGIGLRFDELRKELGRASWRFELKGRCCWRRVAAASLVGKNPWENNMKNLVQKFFHEQYDVRRSSFFLKLAGLYGVKTDQEKTNQGSLGLNICFEG